MLIEDVSGASGDGRHIWSPVTGSLILRDRDVIVSGAATNERIYALHDGHRNITSITNDTGAVIERYTLDPFGGNVRVYNATWQESPPDSPQWLQGATADVWFGMTYLGTQRAWSYFAGSQRIDRVTGLHINDSGTAYNADIDRILSADPNLSSNNNWSWWGYFWDSGDQLIRGEWTESVTLLGTAAQIITGLIGVDAPGDIRDIAANLWNWEWSWSHAGNTGLNVVSLLPIIGMAKYGDEVYALAKGTNKISYASGGAQVGEFSEEMIGACTRINVNAERTLALLPSKGGTGPLRWQTVSWAEKVHGNSLLATGPHDVYAMFDSMTGDILHIGETGRGVATRAGEWRRIFFRQGIDADYVLLDTVEGKAAARQLETQYIDFFRKLSGPDGLKYNLGNH